MAITYHHHVKVGFLILLRRIQTSTFFPVIDSRKVENVEKVFENFLKRRFAASRARLQMSLLTFNEILLDKEEQEQWAVVVAQLAERSLAILEVRGSNPVIGKIYNELIYC